MSVSGRTKREEKRRSLQVTEGGTDRSSIAAPQPGSPSTCEAGGRHGASCALHDEHTRREGRTGEPVFQVCWGEEVIKKTEEKTRCAVCLRGPTVSACSAADGTEGKSSSAARPCDAFPAATLF